MYRSTQYICSKIISPRQLKDNRKEISSSLPRTALHNIGNRSYKALWDSGAAKCVLYLDCYQSISPKFKTELYESSIKIRAANGSFIKNKGDCDITFKINNEQFTFPFLCSDQLSQQLILGHNLAKAFHIGTSWDANDTMSLTINGRTFAEMIPAKDIQALVFCSEGAIVPPY